MSGYDIKTFIDGAISHFWSESYGQIYTTLRKLDGDGLVRSKSKPEEPRSKTTYRITSKGRKVLRQWLEDPPMPEAPRYEISLKLFFGSEIPVEASLDHVRRYRREQDALLETFTAYEAHLKEEATNGRRYVYWRAVLRGGLITARCRIQWCRETEALLEELLEQEGVQNEE